MKRIFLTIIAAMICTGALSARDRLFIGDFTIAAGETRTVAVQLVNDTTYTAFQTDMTLPEGLSVSLDGEDLIIDPTARMDRSHAVSAVELANGSIRILVTSQGSATLGGNDGAVLTIEFVADATFTEGEILLSNSSAVEDNGETHEMNDEVTYVNKSRPFLLGDMDGNGLLEVNDVVILAGLAMEGGADAAALALGDMDGNGLIEVNDVVILAGLVMGS